MTKASCGTNPPIYQQLAVAPISYLAFDLTNKSKNEANLENHEPMNHAYLYTSRLLTSPITYYCPAQRNIANPKNGSFPFRLSTYTSRSGAWPSSDIEEDKVRTGYMYVPQKPLLSGRNPSDNTFAGIALKLDQLAPHRTILTGTINAKFNIPHKTAGGFKINALYGDGHVASQKTNTEFSKLYPEDSQGPLSPQGFKTALEFLNN